jgi:BNR repeat-like domain
MRKLFFTILMGVAFLTGQAQTVAGAGWLTGTGAKGASSGADAGVIVVSQFIFDTAAFPESHAATIAETPRGLAAAWFGGTRERNPDVCIYVSLKDKGAASWSDPVNVANGIQNDTLRYACWNPVLYQVSGGDLLLFYKVGPSPADWKGWLIRSKDGGHSWSKPWALPEGFLGPIKDKPVRLANGTLLCPSSIEGNGWKVHFELTDDKAARWRMAGPVAASGSQADANSENKVPCRRSLFPVSSKLEFLIFRAMVFQGFYPLNGSLQFGDDFRSPFVDKAFGRQPGIGNAVGHISWVSDILAPCEAAPCCNRLSILHTLPGLPLSCQTNRRSAVPVSGFRSCVLHKRSA